MTVTMNETKLSHPSVDERRANGREARDSAPLSDQGNAPKAPIVSIQLDCSSNRIGRASQISCQCVMAE